MKIKWLLAVLIAVGMIGMLPQAASATPIKIGTNLTLQPASAGSSQIAAWLASLVNLYNAANSASLPAPGAEIFRVNSGGVTTGTVPVGYPNFPAGTLAITLPTGDFTYMVLHWGGSPGSTTSETLQAFYTGGEAPGSTFLFQKPEENGLSFYDGFGPRTETPEPTSVVLVGMGLIGLAAGLKRRRQ